MTPRPPLPDTFLGWHEAIRDAPESERAMLLRARGFVTMGAKFARRPRAKRRRG